jgi:hypothetical protein
MKLLIALLSVSVALSGLTLKLKPKEEPAIVGETQRGPCSSYVIENRVPAKVNVVLSCGPDFDDPELDMPRNTRLSVDVCDSRELHPAPHCFILTWSKK